MSIPLEQLALARSNVDRRAELRTNEAAMAAMRSGQQARLICVRSNELLMAGTDLARLPVPAKLEVAYLGSADFDYFSPLDPYPAAVDGDWQGLRQIATRLSDADAGLAVTAVALQNWHVHHQHCARCGHKTRPVSAGWVRHCERDDSQHFPRTDPAIIVGVTDGRDRLLLARQAAWAAGQYSVLAGFCEPGESVEAAVAREVLEESGLRVRELGYLGSQPWPFPASLMLAYEARAEGEIQVDGEEIAEAYWFSRPELAAACEAGDLRIPPAASIAHRIIERWYGSELPADWLRR